MLGFPSQQNTPTLTLNLKSLKLHSPSVFKMCVTWSLYMGVHFMPCLHTHATLMFYMEMKVKDIKQRCNTEWFLTGKHTQTVNSVGLMIKTIIRNHGGTWLLGLVCENKDVRVEPTLEALFFSLISEQLFWQHTVCIVLDPWSTHCSATPTLSHELILTIQLLYITKNRQIFETKSQYHCNSYSQWNLIFTSAAKII